MLEQLRLEFIPSRLTSNMYDITALLQLRPTLEKLHRAKSLGDYLRPVMEWKFLPQVFPHAERLLNLMLTEVEACYGAELKQQADSQLRQCFAVDTGSHSCLPRVYDRATVRSDAQHNMNTLIFQGLIATASAHMAHGHPLNINFSTGRISITNFNSGAYFQPDPEVMVRLLPNKWKDSPQCYVPPISIAVFEESLASAAKGHGLSEAGVSRTAQMRHAIASFPESSFRQIAAAHASLYNQAIGDGIQQISLDYEPIGREFLLELLEDKQSLTYCFFSTEEGRTFLLDEFEGVNTAWRKQEAPFDCLTEDKGVLRFARTPYVEGLTPEDIRDALLAHKIMPKNALLFITFMLEAGIAPVGGMMQTHYATQIRDRLVRWLRQHSPVDPRAEALAAMPTDLAVLTPAWGLSQTNGVQPLSPDFDTKLSKNGN